MLRVAGRLKQVDAKDQRWYFGQERTVAEACCAVDVNKAVEESVLVIVAEFQTVKAGKHRQRQNCGHLVREIDLGRRVLIHDHLNEKIYAIVLFEQGLALVIGHVAQLGFEEVEEHEELVNGGHAIFKSFKVRHDKLRFEQVKDTRCVFDSQQLQRNVFDFDCAALAFSLLLVDGLNQVRVVRGEA